MPVDYVEKSCSDSDLIQKLIASSIITPDEGSNLPKLNEVQKEILQTEVIQNLIKNKKLTLQKALNLTDDELRKLKFNAKNYYKEAIDFLNEKSTEFKEGKIVDLLKLNDEKYQYFNTNLEDQEFKNVFICTFKLCRIISDDVEEEKKNDYQYDSQIAERAYKLLVIFNDTQESKNIQVEKVFSKIGKFMKNHNFYLNLFPFEVALSQDIPILDPKLDLVAWRKFIFERGLSAFYLFRKASQYSFTEKSRIPQEVIRGIAMLQFGKDYDKNPHLAQLCFRYAGDDSQKYFDEIINKKLKETDDIPNVLIDGSQIGHPGYFLTKIQITDPHIFFLGKLVSNCTSIFNKNGKQCVIDAVTLPKNGFYILLKHKKKGKISLFSNDNKINYDQFKIVGAGYCWMGLQNEFVIDSWKNLRESDEPISVNMLKKLAETLCQNFSNIMRVLIGSEKYNHFPMETPEKLLENKTNHLANMVCGIQYPESRKQALLYINNKKSNENSEELDKIIAEIIKKYPKFNLNIKKVKSVINPGTYSISLEYIKWIKFSFLLKKSSYSSSCFLKKIMENSDSIVFNDAGYNIWYLVFSLNVYQNYFQMHSDPLTAYILPIFSLKEEHWFYTLNEQKINIFKDLSKAISQLDSIGILTEDNYLKKILKKFPGFVVSEKSGRNALKFSDNSILNWQKENRQSKASFCNEQYEKEIAQLQRKSSYSLASFFQIFESEQNFSDKSNLLDINLM